MRGLAQFNQTEDQPERATAFQRFAHPGQLRGQLKLFGNRRLDAALATAEQPLPEDVSEELELA